MKKKILSVLLALTMVASLAACDNNGGESKESTSGAPSIDASKMEEAAQAGADFENGKFKETKLKLFQDDNRYYITKCTGILDINTSTEDEPAEDENSSATLSVRTVVLNNLKSLKSDDDTSKEVADAGAKYELTKKNNKAVKIIDKAKFESVSHTAA